MEKDIVCPRVEGLSFGQFLDNLKAMMAGSEEKDRRFAFYLGRKNFAISAKEVNGLINRSRMTLFMREVPFFSVTTGALTVVSPARRSRRKSSRRFLSCPLF